MATKKAKEPKTRIILQYRGRDIDLDDIREAVRKDWEAEHEAPAESVNLYLKVDDDRCYYVIDGTPGYVGM